VQNVEDETCVVRPAEALDVEALATFLRTEVAAVHPERGLPNRASPLHLAQFPGGHSNLTYLARLDEVEIVIRRAPLGPLPARAHDMAREYRWLQAIHAHFPLAPRPLFLCEDPSVIGSVFYGMERRRGFVVRPHETGALDADVDRRRRVSEALVDTLAALHAIDITQDDRLSALGRPGGFVARQVHGWSVRWENAKTTPLPEMDALPGWLESHLPPEPRQPAVVHGDFKLDNVMLDTSDPTRIVAVLDWEMSALGDPLVDVGILLTYWPPTFPQDRPGWHTITGDRRGWLTRDEMVDRYAERSGRNLAAIRFYETFASFKVAVVIQQIFVRYLRGQTSDPRFADLGDRVRALARQAATSAASA
jgi:aminoglycoside phosphotransferase (APT) family kinase protein